MSALFDDLYHTGAQKWVPHPLHSQLLVPSGKVNSYPAPETNSTDSNEIIRSLLSSCLDSESGGGVVNSEQKLLYARVTSSDNVDIGV